MRFVNCVSLLLLGVPTFACEQFRWFEMPGGPEKYAQWGTLQVPDEFEGVVCLRSDFLPMPERLALSLSNTLDSDYMLRVEDRVGTIFERLVLAGTGRYDVTVPVKGTGLGNFRVIMNVISPTQQAFLGAWISKRISVAERRFPASGELETFKATDSAVTMARLTEHPQAEELLLLSVSATKAADTKRLGPSAERVRYDEGTLQRPSDLALPVQ